MKIFKILSLAFIIGVVASCDPYEDAYKDFDEANEIVFEQGLEINLTDDDYGTISNLAMRQAQNAQDSAEAAFVGANGYFTDSIAAADLIPWFLNDQYGQYGPGTSAMVSFNYNGDMPVELKKYAQSLQYEITEADYESVSVEVGLAQYFYPERPARVYVPDILNEFYNYPRPDQVVLVTYNQADSDPVIDTTLSQEEALFVESFDDQANGLGQFADFNVIGEQGWEWVTYGVPENGLKISGYVSGNLENENWLISPAIGIPSEGDYKLTFDHAINYLNGVYSQLGVYITTDFNEADTAATVWQQLTVPNMEIGDSYDFFSSGDIPLTAYAGESVHIAFKYTSTTDNAGTWELDNIMVAPAKDPVSGEAPYVHKEFYIYKNSKWALDADAYFLNTEDYDAMGAPGNYDNFSSSAKPNDYLPALLDAKFPTAGEGVAKTVVYNYYNGQTTITLASSYTKEAGEWVSGYNYIDTETQQFVVGESRGNWMFDPTVRFNMVADDYQIIVDAVADKYGDNFINSYGEGEFYSGANSYYENFDLRISMRQQYEPETFTDNLSDEEATQIIYNRLEGAMVLLLQNKYPDAKPQVNGIPLHFIVGFESYNNDYSRSNWIADMLCTEEATGGNPPQFELVDNTLLKDGEPVILTTD
jgi:hypothetical protein